MLLQIFLTLLLMLVLLFINYCWIKPKKTMRFYEEQLKKTKYNAKNIPYKIFYNYILDKFNEGNRQGDPDLYQKVQLPKYDIVVTNIMNKTVIQFGHVDFMKDYFSVDKHYEYPKYPLLVNQFLAIFGKTVGLSEGNLWKKKRAVNNKLFNFDFVKNQIPTIIQICDRCIEQMEQKAKKGEDESGRYVQCHLLDDLLTKIFSSVIFSGFLGLKEKEKIDGIQVSEYLVKLMDDVSIYRIKSPTMVLGNWFYDLQLRKIDKSINQRKVKLRDWGKKIIRQQILQFQEELKQNDHQIEINNLTKAYMISKKEKKLSDSQISEQDIFNEFLGLFFGGTDTTSNFLNVMLCFIGKNPQIEKKLREEIQENLKNDDYSYENLKNFKYIDALQKQTTRFYGPAGSNLIRQTLNDNYLNGLAIKKGTLISINWRSNHYSQKYFKQPFKFRPERWLNGQCDNLDPFVHLGFSAGARTCVGKHLAMVQSKVALIKIMKRYKKIKLGKQQFKWEIKMMVAPQHFETKLTIDEENQKK